MSDLLLAIIISPVELFCDDGISPSFSAQIIAPRYDARLSVAEEFILRCGAWDTTGEQHPAVSIIAQCQAFLDAATNNAVIEWPSARPPNPPSEWAKRHSIIEWLKQQFEPTPVIWDKRNYCLRNARQTSLSGLSVCPGSA